MAEAVRSPALLIVDNDELLLRAIARELTRRGFEVVTTSNPTDALSMVTSGMRFRAGVFDVEMPEMTGLDLATHIRDLGVEMPTIFMSAFVHVVPADGQMFLEKPFVTATLLRTLAELGVEQPATNASCA